MSVADMQRELEEIDRERMDSLSKVRILQRKFDQQSGSGYRKHYRDTARDDASDDRSVKRRMITVEGGKRRVDLRGDGSDADAKKDSVEVTKAGEDGSSVTITMEGVAKEEEKPKKRPDRFALGGRARGDNTDRTRGKRLFGVLLGQLNRAKERITKDSKTGGAIKTQGEAKQKAISRLRTLKAEDRKRLEVKFSASKAEELKKQHALLKKARATVNTYLETSLGDHERRLSSFILTTTQPAVRWLPKRHNKKTEELLSKCKDACLERTKQGFVTMKEEEKEFQVKKDAELEAEIAALLKTATPANAEEGEGKAEKEGEQEQEADKKEDKKDTEEKDQEDNEEKEKEKEAEPAEPAATSSPKSSPSRSRSPSR